MFLKYYKLWLMSWKAYLRGQAISFHPLSKQQCNVCLCCNICEEKLDIILLPLTSSLPESIKNFLESEELTGANRWFCPSCNDLTKSSNEIKFIKVGTIAIFPLERYIMLRGNPVRDTKKVKFSSDPLKIPVSCEITVSFSVSFSLHATMHHSVTSHFWSFKRDKHANKRMKCNDTSVTPVQQKSLTNETSYILFYSQPQ